MTQLEKAIEENRRMAHELVTPDLKDQPLVDQLGFLVQTMLLPSGLDVQIRVSRFKESLLDEQRKLAIYRIAQEQCTNIIKYATANKVVFNLITTPDHFTMTISDDGQGMDRDKAAKGIGLKNMEGRIGFFEGSLKVRSKKGKGFTLEVDMPLVNTTASV
jgi:signal transduction histidine kinase